MKEITLKYGDPCPRDGGSFKAARIASDAEYAKSVDRENPVMLPEGTDSASPEFRAEHGNLFKCTSCGYQTRFVIEAPAATAAVGN